MEEIHLNELMNSGTKYVNTSNDDGNNVNLSNYKNMQKSHKDPLLLLVIEKVKI